jgi:alpha-1,3/alpha-1,6-mannosyltransferase
LTGADPSRRRLRVAFLHPELGLGGAERFVVDSALELQARGHEVVIFAAARDGSQSLPATRDGRLDVRIRGGFIPARIAGRLQAACTAARLWYGAAALQAAAPELDVVVSDVVPYAVPLLRLLAMWRPGRRAKIVYYCHFPDQLLAPARGGLRRLYRWPLDRLEGPAMRLGDLVLANSRFTAEAVARLGGGTPEVVYPGVDLDVHAAVPELTGRENLLLVVCRFDPRKNLALAVEAFAQVVRREPGLAEGIQLILAGHLNAGRADERDTAERMRALVARLGLAGRVVLRPSPTEPERLELLARSLAVVHPTPDECFGLVPIEAMAAGRPVVAVSNAGPLETVVDGQTGFLREPTPEAFAGAMVTLLGDRAGAARLGRAGRAHVAARFSRRHLGDALEGALRRLVLRPMEGVA